MKSIEVINAFFMSTPPLFPCSNVFSWRLRTLQLNARVKYCVSDIIFLYNTSHAPGNYLCIKFYSGCDEKRIKWMQRFLRSGGQP
jgi:hypothetical protein